MSIDKPIANRPVVPCDEAGKAGTQNADAIKDNQVIGQIVGQINELVRKGGRGLPVACYGVHCLGAFAGNVGFRLEIYAWAEGFGEPAQGRTTVLRRGFQVLPIPLRQAERGPRI
jgi:hypothetical protein